MKIDWKAAVAFSSLVLAACGGGGGNAALSKSFNYGAPSAPTAAEQTAATSAQGTMTATSSFGTSPDATKASSIVGLADDLAASAIGSSAIAASGWAQDPRVSHMIRTAATLDTCTTVTPTSVTFTNCSETDSGFTFTLNGSISVTTSATGNVLNWDIRGGFSGVDQGITFNLALHQSGKLTVTPTTVDGDALSEIGGSVSGNGQSVSFGLDTAVGVHLTYTPSCITSGTIEVKRVWAQRPNGATGPAFADVGVKLSWTGCNTVQVQHSM